MREVIDFQGRKVEGEVISFKLITPEQWNDYQLADGTVLRVKSALVSVARLDEYNPDGKPVYVINTHNNVFPIIIPKELRKKQE